MLNALHFYVKVQIRFITSSPSTFGGGLSKAVHGNQVPGILCQNIGNKRHECLMAWILEV